MGRENGIIGRAFALLKSRRPAGKRSRRIGFSPEETGLLRKAGKELLRSLTDEELDAELSRREREKLIDFGLARERNKKPKRPETPFDDRIQERKQLEQERKPLMLEKRAAFFEAKDKLRAARRAHPSDLDAEERAERAVADARFAFERAEQDWKRARSGARALRMARSRWIATKEYEDGLRRTGRM